VNRRGFIKTLGAGLFAPLALFKNTEKAQGQGAPEICNKALTKLYLGEDVLGKIKDAILEIERAGYKPTYVESSKNVCEHFVHICGDEDLNEPYYINICIRGFLIKINPRMDDGVFAIHYE